MRIVQINAVYEYSSTGRTTMEMHEYLLSNNYKSYVFCTNRNIPEKFVYKIGSDLDYKVHSFLSHLTDRQACFSIRATKKLIKQLDGIAPDVIILRNLHANYINISLLLRYIAKKDIPTIVVLHDVWAFTGHCCYYTAHGCDKWLRECGKCPALHDYNSSWFIDNSKNNFHLKKKLFRSIKRLAIIGVSDWVINEARKSPVFENARIMERIYNWIDLDKFKPTDSLHIKKRLGITSQFVTVSVAQGWCEGKGLLKIFEVANKLPEVRFILVGKMDYDGQIPHNVISVGVTSSVHELAQYYSLADVLLVCSVQETFGKVSAEALACGTPVISNNYTANPEIAGKFCGLSFNNNNPEEIVHAINEIMQRGKPYFSELCIGRARSEFNFDIQILKYLELFDKLNSWKV